MNIEEKRDFKVSNRELVTLDSDMELFPIVNESGEVIGKMLRSETHDGSKKLHPVVHLHVYNTEGQLYLQHRAVWKKIQPDKWDTATGGHVDYGETIYEALAREVYEEIGLAPGTYEPKFLKKYVFETPRARELVYIFTTVYEGELLPSETETQGGRFWSPEEIKANIGMNVFTPMFEQEYSQLSNH